MRVKVAWLNDAAFLAQSGSGHEVRMDGPPEGGGNDSGARPMEMLLMGLGGCSSYDIVSILKKARQNITACEVEISAERAETPPKVFTRIHLHFKISGICLKDKQVQKAILLSAEKYCSASIMLGKSAEITHDYEIIES